jgi:hypothetical protein
MIFRDHFSGGVQHVIWRAGIELGLLAAQNSGQNTKQN